VEAAGAACQLLRSDHGAATIRAAGQVEQDLAPAVQAPERLAVVFVGTLADLARDRSPANETPDARRIADPRDDAHSSLC
jgi:hypothetical protein